VDESILVEMNQGWQKTKIGRIHRNLSIQQKI